MQECAVVMRDEKQSLNLCEERQGFKWPLARMPL